MSEEKMSTLGEVEEAVFKQEGIRIVFRAPPSMECKEYKHEYGLNTQAKVEHLMYRVGLSTKMPFVIVDGTANTVHAKDRTLQNLVRTYQRF
jgi:hypothetical protein